jgi:predicted GH43/DUF377 family glycosyl hydrolase
MNRLSIQIRHDERRVITRLFAFNKVHRLQEIIDRVRSLSLQQAEETYRDVLNSFEGRHRNLQETFRRNFRQVCELTGVQDGLSELHQLLMGSYFTMEYSLESTALFNPSIVPHPCQAGLTAGQLRFVMSLRATGEGHVSSIVFRTGIIEGEQRVRLDPPPQFPRATQLAPDQTYLKHLFQRKLSEMSARMATVDLVLDPLPDEFSFAALQGRIAEVQSECAAFGADQETIQAMLWLARSNYRLQLHKEAAIQELIIFPHTESESRGIEDLRLVRFTDDGEVTYFGTYTAFDGFRTLPMLLETKDFRRVGIHTLNGACACDKGMALFPRRINNHYAMCSRLDGQNLYIMYSDMVHFWESAALLAKPLYPWELMLVGNCGSPIETEQGWLLLTHGVGPMRRYSIGAMLLDIEDPTKVIGRLREPLLAPSENEREGYTPNVVYSCGSLLHKGRLYIPYAMSDRATSTVSVDPDELINRLLESPPPGP